MKVAVIGAGIYGCHIASVLLDYGINVEIIEKNDDIFLSASGNNQFRLHLGYHYARDHRTRQQSKFGFTRFMETYKDFTEEVKDNYYVVPKYHSLIDFRTYMAIFSHEAFNFELLKVEELHFLKNIDGAINVEERVICVAELKKYFLHKLKDRIKFGEDISKSKLTALKSQYDFVIDCTWGKLEPLLDSFYEVTHLAYCKLKNKTEHPALTFVDGNLWSLYPTENSGIFTLSHVKHTPLFQTNNIQEANEYIKNLKKSTLQKNYKKMLDDVIFYYPNYEDNFECVADQISIKTKIIGSNDPRDCRVWKQGNLIRVFSGKIDTLYVAEEFILNELL